MSILVVQVVYEGILFGADRNITTSVTRNIGGQATHMVFGQSQRRKVLRWPNNRALVGYVGAAQMAGIPMDEWLYSFIGRNLDFLSFDELAHRLRAEVQAQRSINEGTGEAQGLIIHVGGFEEREGVQVPVIWFITNCHRLDPVLGYTDVRRDFGVTEELWRPIYVDNATPHTIRDYLNTRARAYEPFWFHQGFDLGVFNTLDHYLRQSFRLLIEAPHLDIEFPTTLDEWEKHLSMSILTYGAYFQSFYGPGEQYVGGGVDIVSLPWPD